MRAGTVLQLAKLYKMTEREASRAVGVASAVEFALEHRFVLKIRVVEDASVAVFLPALGVEFD